MKILVAEDETLSRTLLTSLLEKWGYEVIATDNGQSAWEILSGPDAPKLAILDWMMPGMEGVEIVSRLREKENGTPSYIIILTARDAKEDIVAALNAGANDYIVKFFDPNELKARVSVGVRMVILQEELAGKVRDLEEALAHIRTLQGILPICMYCHKIRTDQQSWERLEAYIQEHSEAEFSHSICPDCLEKYFPEKD